MKIEDYQKQIEAALGYSGGTHSFEDVVLEVENGTLQFWPGPHSVIITEIQEHPQKRILHFFLAGGNLAEIQRMVPLIEDWGREQGCTTASLAGRKGWERTFLQHSGWKPKLVLMSKDL